MLQQSYKPFPTPNGGKGLVLTDGINLSAVIGTAGRTPGSTVIGASQLSPSLTQNWKILSVGFTAYLGLTQNGPIYGLLGKVIAGLIFNNPTATNPIALPPAYPLLPLPTDPTVTTTLWDGGNDPVPPQVPSVIPSPAPYSVSSLLAIAGSIALPVPIAIPPGGSYPIGVGLWLTPSLIGQPVSSQVLVASLSVYLAGFTVDFDNGL